MQSSLSHFTTHSLTAHSEDFGLIGHSAAMERLRLQIHRIGPHFRSVLLTGEPGTGKALIARALHSLAMGPDAPFVSDISSTMDNVATFRGTLFLNELGEIPLAAQGALLRALQQQDLRVVAATRYDLRPHVQAGGFRKDLYERLATIEIPLPPLRSHLEDLEELAAHFISLSAHQHGKPSPTLSAGVLGHLASHAWPGNVRELEEVIHYAIAQTREDVLEIPHLPGYLCAEDSPAQAPPSPLPLGKTQRLDDIVYRHVSYVLGRCGGNKLRAAECLGISRSTLYRMLEKMTSSQAAGDPMSALYSD